MQTFTVIALLLGAVFFAMAAFGGPAVTADGNGRGFRAYVAWLPLGLLAWISVPLVIAVRAL